MVDDRKGGVGKILLAINTGSNAISKARAFKLFEQEKERFMNEFRNILDQIVLPSQKWKYFDVTFYPAPFDQKKKLQTVVSGPYGKGISYGQWDFNDEDSFKANGLPAKILVSSVSRIGGI